MRLKNRLKELRVREKLNQKQLADRIGISRQMIGLIERGKNRPSVIIALKIANFFGEKIEDVFEIDND